MRVVGKSTAAGLGVRRRPLQYMLRERSSALRTPAPHAPGVEMDEIRLRVIPHAAQAEGQRGITQLGGVHPRETHIDRAALEMQAVHRDTAARLVQLGIGFRRTIARDHLDLAAARSGERMQGIEQPPIHWPDLTGAEIPQQPVNTGERGRQIRAAGEIDDFEPFTGVRVAEGERAIRGRQRRRGAGEAEWCEREPLQQPAPGIGVIRGFSRNHCAGLGVRLIVARILYHGLLAVAAVLACGPAVASDAVAEALRARIEQLRAAPGMSVDGARIASRSLIPEFYERRGMRPAWTRPEQARALLELIEASTAHGLDPDDYHAPVLRSIRAAPAPSRAGSIADRELLLTDALIRLTYHLHFGKVSPRELYPDWTFTRSLGTIDPAGTLEAMLAAPRLEDAVERFAPQLPEYRQLREALARLRAIHARGGWPQLPPGPSLKPGQRQQRVAALRGRLVASNDLASGADSDGVYFDAALEAAVRRFQAQHGLESDGVVGRRTLQALNVRVDQRIDQVRVNLERLRWVAQDLAGDYLIVDIAGFTARLFRDGRLVWSSRTVVGRPYRETPVFRASLRYLVLNPSWEVPPTILKEDILPRLARDPGYLARNHMQVVDAAHRPVDAKRLPWARYRAGGFPYRIVQAPGDDNPLGKIKFMLPNPHAVYLHDTPVQRLFERNDRAFSSGCIRLERAFELAVLLLDDAAGWSAQDIQAAIATGETRTLSLKRQVPVLILYFTAEADGEGGVRFSPDLYGRDAGVLAGLRAPFRFAPVDRRRAR